MYAHILVALDGSELAEQVLPHIEALAEKFGSAVTLLRATTPFSIAVTPPIGLPMTASADPYTTQQMIEALEEEQRQASVYLRSVGDRLRGRLAKVTEEVAAGSPDDVIVERASALNVDLIAMTTHGRSGLRRLVLGSVAEEVLRRAACAVLLVRVSADGGAT
jgi:nucleotide-binding universal stress UspA family protein